MRLAAALLALAFAPAAVAATPPAEAVAALLAGRDALGEVPFPVVVRTATGHRVLPVKPRRHARLLATLGGALDVALRRLNDSAHPIHSAGRVNEASRFLEDEIRRAVNALPGWQCTAPLTRDGREQRSGYPDLRVATPDGTILYLDPKLFEAESRGSTLRTFYYEPRALTGKIQDDAIHLLVGVAHVGRDATTLRLTGWELIDASRLRVQLKAEFQASNADLYRPEMVVGRSRR